MNRIIIKAKVCVVNSSIRWLRVHMNNNAMSGFNELRYRKYDLINSWSGITVGPGNVSENAIGEYVTMRTGYWNSRSEGRRYRGQDMVRSRSAGVLNFVVTNDWCKLPMSQGGAQNPPVNPSCIKISAKRLKEILSSASDVILLTHRPRIIYYRQFG